MAQASNVEDMPLREIERLGTVTRELRRLENEHHVRFAIVDFYTSQYGGRRVHLSRIGAWWQDLMLRWVR